MREKPFEVGDTVRVKKDAWHVTHLGEEGTVLEPGIPVEFADGDLEYFHESELEPVEPSEGGEQ